jgi:hypothetical protein
MVNVPADKAVFGVVEVEYLWLTGFNHQVLPLFSIPCEYSRVRLQNHPNLEGKPHLSTADEPYHFSMVLWAHT